MDSFLSPSQVKAAQIQALMRKKKTASFCIYDAKTSMAGHIMVLTGKVALCQSQWKSSGFTSGKQLKDQTAFNTSGSWERAQEGPSFLLFLYF